MRMRSWHPRLGPVLLIFLAFTANGFANSQLPTRAENPARTSPQLPPANEIPPLVDSTTEQTKTEQYTLSHERYEKAVALFPGPSLGWPPMPGGRKLKPEEK